MGREQVIDKSQIKKRDTPPPLPFKALGPGLGLGKIKTQPSPVLSGRPQPVTPKLTSPPSKQLTAPPRQGTPPRAVPRVRKTHRTPWQDYLLVGLTDFLLVVISLWVIVAMAIVYAATVEPRGSKSGLEHLLTLRPMVLLFGLKPWMALVGLLGIYGCYMITFLTFAGETFGRGLLRQLQTQARQGIAPARPRRL